MSQDFKSEDIKKIHWLNGWYQETFARRVGVSLATAHRWEKAKCKPSRLARRELDVLLKEMANLERFTDNAGNIFEKNPAVEHAPGDIRKST